MKTLNGRMIFGKELTFDEKRHLYLYNGEKVPSVTGILKCLDKPALVPWAAKMTSQYWLDAMKAGRNDHDVIFDEAKASFRKKTTEAANIGTNVHNYAEAFFKKLPAPELLTDAAKRGAEAFHKWVDAHNIQILAVERRIYSQQYNYCGTTDFVAKIDGVLGIGDYKTSSGIYPEMRLQTAAYQHALQEEKGMEFAVRWIVRFDKVTGEFEAKPFYDFKLDFSGFLGALSLHNALKVINDRKNQT